MPDRRLILRNWVRRTLKVGAIFAIVRGGAFWFLTSALWTQSAGYSSFFLLPFFWPEILIWREPSIDTTLGALHCFGVLMIGSFAWGLLFATGAAIVDLVLPDLKRIDDDADPTNQPTRKD